MKKNLTLRIKVSKKDKKAFHNYLSAIASDYHRDFLNNDTNTMFIVLNRKSYVWAYSDNILNDEIIVDVKVSIPKEFYETNN
jgi:hypothetical protein